MTRVFLVDDHDLFRAGVRAEIGEHVELVGEADAVDAAIEMIREREPDVVLLALSLRLLEPERIAAFSSSGGIVGSSLESSNTDISEEFTKLIVTQQAYAAGTRIVSTAYERATHILSEHRAVLDRIAQDLDQAAFLPQAGRQL